MITPWSASLVFTSGAGTSDSGPDHIDHVGGVPPRELRQLGHRHLRGIARDPPLPPPKGMPTTAHFHVIQAASAIISSSVTSG